MEARLQIYHSFIQFHINYCSFLWGFTSKSNIYALFTKQKNGLRAVIPGFIIYGYRDGDTDGHTKSAFTNYKILTTHGILTLSTLIYINKIRNLRHTLCLL